MSIQTRLFVGNLPESVNEQNLRNAFAEYGQVDSVDIKCKSNDNDKKQFAFVTLSATNYNIEKCIKHFCNEGLSGSKIYVTKARESFMERLQRERQQIQKKDTDTFKSKPDENVNRKHPVINLSAKLNPGKRKLDIKYVNSDNNDNIQETNYKREKITLPELETHKSSQNNVNNGTVQDKKKKDSDKKRMESMNKKRQEFREKQMIIRSGLIGIDKVPNKKVIFSDNEDSTLHPNSDDANKPKQNKTLFDDEDSGDDVNFEIKEQFEGKRGQKVLDLQSRYKSDKRFVLDERFVDDNSSGDEDKEEGIAEKVDLEQKDEKAKQLNILQDVLGVQIQHKTVEMDVKKMKPKLGMLRFDPTQPDHAKFLAPVKEADQVQPKQTKKKKEKQEVEVTVKDDKKIEVSKEQFYKISDTLKEAITQPTNFSFRSLFSTNENNMAVEENESNEDYCVVQKSPKEPKLKNPLDPGQKNPFVYDSSDSETEDPPNNVTEMEAPQVENTMKPLWKENLFFSTSDVRLKDALDFFNKPSENVIQKERRELKSVMKKRIYNKERKNQMFQKKIGGRKKTIKKVRGRKINK